MILSTIEDRQARKDGAAECLAKAPFKDGSYEITCRRPEGHSGEHAGIGAGYNGVIWCWAEQGLEVEHAHD